ncbi:MAG: hypothetical protein OSB58_14335 [Alphaproteobacteria bacterium]|nr:hypothetical protein [Alphaproteobacteria bacterium]
MIRAFTPLAVLLFAGLVVFPTLAQKAPAQKNVAQKNTTAVKTSVLIPVTNSAKDIEILIAKLLKEHFKLESSLKLVNDDPENLRLQVPVTVDKKQGIPPMISLIDTTIVARDKAGNPLSQTISIAATADLLFKKEQMPKLLAWANAWNARMLPIRIFIVESRVFTAATIHGTISEPTTSDRVLDTFRGVIQVWASVMRDLRANKFIPEKTAAKEPEKK